MRQNRSFATLIFIVILAAGAALTYPRYKSGDDIGAATMGAVAFLIAVVISSGIQVADQWDKAVILRLGQSHSLRGPGFYFIIPVIDSIPYWIDTNPVAFHLRAMNMLYEGLKENATIVLVPSTAVESMQLGGIAGMTALAMGIGQESGNGHKDVPASRIPEANGV